MAANSSIEWTDATWNPVRGCTRVSEGCRNCYAEIMAARFSKPGQWGHGLANMVKLPDGKTDHRWTGAIAWAESQVMLPLQWSRPRRIFVNSTSDLFHDEVKDEWLDHIFAVMMLSPQHTFQILTKRPERMARYLAQAFDNIAMLAGHWCEAFGIPTRQQTCEEYGIPWRQAESRNDWWPLRNVWLGTSVEDQDTADDRIPHLLATPAAVRFISAEPLLGPINFRAIVTRWGSVHDVLAGKIISGNSPSAPAIGRLDWVICGGESGPGARPMHPDWARSLRDQCAAANVPFFFKQWGEWAPHKPSPGGDLGGDYRAGKVTIVYPTGESEEEVFRRTNGRNTIPGTRYMAREGKQSAGRLLDGRQHNDMPSVRP